jgi:hypothetical protein
MAKRRRPRRLERTTSGQSSPYPWQQWITTAETEVVTLRRGTDYQGRSDTFVQQIRNWAGRFGVRVRTRIGSDGESISFWVRDGAADRDSDDNKG